MKHTSQFFILSCFVLSFFGSVKSFSDIDSQDPAFISVMYLREDGVVEGYQNNTFLPERRLSRAGALKLIFEAFHIKTGTATKSIFSDVSVDSWFAPYVNFATWKKIIQHSEYFSPDRPVTRAEFFKILVTTLEVDVPKVKKGEPWYTPYIQFGVRHDILVPHKNETYPHKYVTRLEAANWIFLTLNQGKALEEPILLRVLDKEIYRFILFIRAENIFEAQQQNAFIKRIVVSYFPKDRSKNFKTYIHYMALSTEYILQGLMSMKADKFKRAEYFYKKVWAQINDAKKSRIEGQSIASELKLKELSHHLRIINRRWQDTP